MTRNFLNQLVTTCRPHTKNNLLLHYQLPRKFLLRKFDMS
jgi:hypothetical protein